MALLRFLPRFWFHIASRVDRDYLRPFLKLEASPIELENCHNCAPGQNTFLQVAVLFTVEIFFAFRRHVISHMFRKVHKVGLQISRTCIDNPVDEEGEEFFLRRAAFDIRRTACADHLVLSFF